MATIILEPSNITPESTEHQRATNSFKQLTVPGEVIITMCQIYYKNPNLIQTLDQLALGWREMYSMSLGRAILE